jgi:hypothetical protein
MAWDEKEHRQKEFERFQEDSYQSQRERDRASSQRMQGLPHYTPTNLGKFVGIVGLVLLGIALISWILSSKFNISIPEIAGMSIPKTSASIGFLLTIVGMTPAIAVYIFWLFIAIQIFGTFLVSDASGNWIAIIIQIVISIIYIKFFFAKEN